MSTHPITPMLATLGRPPKQFADFAVEAKYDGQRGIAIVEAGTVKLLSRNGADITHTFPEITAAMGNRRVILRRPDLCPRQRRISASLS
jgi:bifunctional non-homologous end joining protein LigD